MWRRCTPEKKGLLSATLSSRRMLGLLRISGLVALISAFIFSSMAFLSILFFCSLVMDVVLEVELAALLLMDELVVIASWAKPGIMMVRDRVVLRRAAEKRKEFFMRK